MSGRLVGGKKRRVKFKGERLKWHRYGATMICEAVKVRVGSPIGTFVNSTMAVV